MSDHDAEDRTIWDERAKSWDEQKEAHNYAQQAFSTLRKIVIEQWQGEWGHLRVLDFGAGTGLLTEKLVPLCKEVVALDISPKMIDELKAKAKDGNWDNCEAMVGAVDSSETLALAPLSQPFDLIVASSVCSFLRDFPSDLARLSAMLRTGGLFVQWDWHADAAGEWSRGFNTEQIRDAYKFASLTPLTTEIDFLFSFGGKEVEVILGVGQK